MEQILYPLPDGWNWHKLKELTTKIGSGATPKGGDKAYKPSGISLIRSLNVHDCLFKEDRLAFIDNEQADALKNVIVENGDVLLNITGASIARCCIVPDEFLPARVNQHVTIIRPTEKVDSKFLNYLIVNPKFKAQLLWQGAGGATRQALTKAMVEELDIPLPSFAEQKRIVKKLDALLTRIDTAIVHLQESVTLADAFFKSTLSSLVCSESTEHEKLSLEELGSFSGGGTPSKNKSEFWNGEILWITPKDMKSPVITNSELKITQEGVRGSSAKFIPPRSVLIVARSGILRHTLPVCINESECTVNQDIKVFIPNEKISSEYVQHMLKGYESFILSELVKGGVTVESLKYNDFQNFKFPIPSIEEQKKIVEQLSQVRKITDPIKVELCIKIEYLQQLKASILDSAFKGEL